MQMLGCVSGESARIEGGRGTYIPPSPNATDNMSLRRRGRCSCHRTGIGRKRIMKSRHRSTRLFARADAMLSPHVPGKVVSQFFANGWQIVNCMTTTPMKNAIVKAPTA